MIDLGKQLKELMDDKEILKLKDYFNFNSTATIYDWLTNKYLPNFENIIKLANYFNVNLDFLLGRTEFAEKVFSKEVPKFSTQLRTVIKQNKSSQYKLLKDNVISRGHLNSWLNKEHLPSVENLVKIADYLKISIDELVGRV